MSTVMKAQKTSPCRKLKKFQRCSFLRKNIEIDAYRSGAANQVFSFCFED